MAGRVAAAGRPGPCQGAGHGPGALPRPGRGRERRRRRHLAPAQRLCAGHVCGRAARPAQRAGPELGPAAAQSAASAALALRAFHRHPARQHAARRRPAAGPCDGPDAPVLAAAARRGWRGGNLCRLPARRPAGHPGAGERAPPLHGHRRRPRQRGVRHAQRHAVACAAVLPPAVLRARHGYPGLCAARHLARPGPGRGQHPRPAHAARLLARRRPGRADPAATLPQRGRPHRRAADPHARPPAPVRRAGARGPGAR